ncbi:hypothetical protein [Rickettsia hoogstraalii]|uniref:hypothetical protein n=1 Tax=Rickettsia hoogstraalii TaxID=467174 RepID=UPI0018CF9CDE|nr:hypothetical protein [Rickettsia hoogstraalii]
MHGYWSHHCEEVLLRGPIFRHCEKNYVVIRRSNPVKNSNLQNFLNLFLDCHAPYGRSQ